MRDLDLGQYGSKPTRRPASTAHGSIASFSTSSDQFSPYVKGGFALARDEFNVGNSATASTTRPRLTWSPGAALMLLTHLVRLCDQWHRRNFIPRCFVIRRSRADDGFKTEVTFPTAPKVTILLLTPILGPLGGNKLVAALGTAHPKGRTTIGYHRRHGNLPRSFPPTSENYHDSHHRGESILSHFLPRCSKHLRQIKNVSIKVRQTARA